MIQTSENQDIFSLSFEPETYRRTIAGKEIVVHCHHYNARLQRIIEGTTQIDGKTIFLNCTEEIFADYVSNLFSPTDDYRDKWRKAVELYTHLGFGILDISQLDNGIVTAPVSHFVEGWNVGFRGANCTICTFTEGFLQGAMYAIAGKVVTVHEEICLISGAEVCRFVFNENRDKPFPQHKKQHFAFTPKSKAGYIKSASIDEKRIIEAVVDMPFYGNNSGLIPAFNVYLANMPANFYSLLCNTFVNELQKINMHTTAKNLLIYAGEVCALNTLRGIKASEEWKQLIQPMVIENNDNLHGLIAVTNALGWGNWHVSAHQAGEHLELESLNGYEALGYLGYQQYSNEGHCYMLTGVAAGIMALLYSDGTVAERTGTFYSEETACICSHAEACHFHVEAL